MLLLSRQELSCCTLASMQAAATAHLRNSDSMASSSAMGRLGFFSRLKISSISSKSVV